MANKKKVDSFVTIILIIESSVFFFSKKKGKIRAKKRSVSQPFYLKYTFIWQSLTKNFDRNPVLENILVQIVQKKMSK